MSFLITPYAVAEWCSALVAAAVAVQLWRRRASHGGMMFFLTMVAVFIWAVASGFEAAVVGIAGKLLFSTLAYVGTVSVAPLFLLFSLEYLRQGWRPPWWVLVGLWLVPVATLALAASNASHGLVWSSLTPAGEPGSTIVIYGHGPWFWFALAYDAGLTLAAAAIIGWTAMHTQGLYAWQTVILLVGLALPWIGAALYLLPANPFPGLEVTPIGFAFSGLLLLAGLRLFRLLDVIPVARDLLVEKMTDGLVVLDDQGRIVDINPVARRLFGVEHRVIGRRLEEAVPALSPALALLTERGDVGTELALPGEPARHLNVRSSVLGDRPGAPSGHLLVIRDLTERRLLELERERLIAELRAALADIKTLQGLLPICSSCKKIRDDQGYWRTLERYFADHSDIQFSHGLCPDCLRRLYPEIADRISGSGEPSKGP